MLALVFTEEGGLWRDNFADAVCTDAACHDATKLNRKIFFFFFFQETDTLSRKKNSVRHCRKC